MNVNQLKPDMTTANAPSTHFIKINKSPRAHGLLLLLCLLASIVTGMWPASAAGTSQIEPPLPEPMITSASLSRDSGNYHLLTIGGSSLQATTSVALEYNDADTLVPVTLKHATATDILAVIPTDNLRAGRANLSVFGRGGTSISVPVIVIRFCIRLRWCSFSIVLLPRISAPSLDHSSGQYVLIVNGEGFSEDTLVTFLINGSEVPLKPASVSDTQLRLTVADASSLQLGSVSITVQDPAGLSATWLGVADDCDDKTDGKGDGPLACGGSIRIH